MSFLSKIFGDANQRYIDSLKPTISRINSLENDFEQLSDSGLKEKTIQFRERLSQGETLDDLLPEAFAAVREASKRALGQRHFDVQLMGGMALHQGKISEMKTGEGKTLVATLPAYLNALAVPPATAFSGAPLKHDSSFLYDPLHSEKIHELENNKSGLPVPSPDSKEAVLDKERDLTGSFRVVHEFLRPVTRRDAYEADITYGTNNEYGFDYLRDNMAYTLPDISQSRGHNFAIVDEVDSILIDEARTPLIISAPDTESTKMYETFSKIVPRLIENEDYNVDEKLKAVSITEKGIEKVEKMLGLKNIYEEGGVRNVHHLEQALKAEILFKRDRDYVVNPSTDGGEVIIVDEFTGRLMPGRRWSEGLHQAVEAKEGVKVEKESRTLATITFQNYFRLYKKLAGMTGTAQTSAEEFHRVYNLSAIEIPTNKPMIRRDAPDRIYKTETGKFRAIAKEIKEKHEKGQPVLVGTVSIEKNEILSALLNREGIPHNVLNAKNHEREAEIIAQAGRSYAVTVATNMAGRGVDIILGGSPRFGEASNPIDAQEAQKVREAGGLHVIGTERHEARRIDDQLRGRAGRQGDPGSSQFFISTEDDLARIFGGDRLKRIMETLGVGEDDVIENRFVSNAIGQAQSRIEGHNFDIRKYVLEYDDVMNKHREAIYRLRKDVLSLDNNKEKIIGYLNGQIDNLVAFHAQGQEYEWNIEEISESIKALSGLELHSELIEISKSKDPFKLVEFIKEKISALYEAKEKELGTESMKQLEKLVLLRTVDELWMGHIDAMEYLRDSVRLRAYGQRDPLVEYKTEGHKMFQQLTGAIEAEVANLIFKVGFVNQPKKIDLKESRPNIVSGEETAIERESQSRQGQPAESEIKIGRNDPCPCGATHSDGRPKKYKHCHGR
ncbi:MAG: Protein translocase subunit SecA [Candidatus Yanofskybacteria bacterium GW2011_GWA2_41_22]|uniref:Protein translocase subunit SecA n=1 Tax=Candidatus Yanofskybacteria bacterium GW2011_GWA2_41_22 TaxID=1619023 RepID=A0A0G0VNH5_9BACT|nr:MAG: Protein translocase subunit SecA [Candidatus Yanofskybacteria bacterium GW2011_GWA2_41_22]